MKAVLHRAARWLLIKLKVDTDRLRTWLFVYRVSTARQFVGALWIGARFRWAHYRYLKRLDV